MSEVGPTKPEQHPAFMFAMGELSGQVRGLSEELAYQREDRVRQHAENELARKEDRARLDALENWRYLVLGAAAGITAVVNIIAYLWEHH